MRFNKILDDLKMPPKAQSWVRRMKDGDTFVIGKFTIANPASTHRAQAVIMKNGDEWIIDSIWSFPPVFQPAKIHSSFTFSNKGNEITLVSGSQEDINMSKEVVRRIALHQQTMNETHKAECIVKGYNVLYASLWLGSDGVSKNVVFKEGGLAQPVRARFKSDFIHRTMINEKCNFDYFSGGKAITQTMQ